MLKRLNHIAIAVPNAVEAARVYERRFKIVASQPQEQIEHGVITVFVALPNVLIEFLEPLGEDSPITNFLSRNPVGGIHHLCFEVDNIAESISHLAADGVRVLGDGTSKIGAHGNPVIFLHPKDCFGTLLELEEC